MRIIDNCIFCSQNRFELNRIAEIPAEDSIVFEDENVFACPDLSPLAIGHVLVVSKEHYCDFALSTEDVLASLRKAQSYILDNQLYRHGYIIFEHGSNKGGSSIEHAHMHIIPSSISILENIRNNLKTVHSFQEIAGPLYIPVKVPYLFVKESSCRDGILFFVADLPSQFMRKAFKEIDYNWKMMYNETESKNMFMKTLQLFKEQTI